MSFKRTIIWHCDHCGFEQPKEGYGLPSGWAWYQQKNQPIQHVCRDCLVPEDVSPEAQERVK